jgi:hypothetical protein
MDEEGGRVVLSHAAAQGKVTGRPEIRCLIARPLKNGGIGKSRLVKLSTAFLALKAGLYVVGPDPEDVAALARWERDNLHRARFNCARWRGGAA